jgi:flavin reductase
MSCLVSKESFVGAMRKAAASVNVVTTRDAAGRHHGVTVSAMCSVTADPPTLLVCLYKEATVAKAVAESGVFCVNILSANQMEIAECFAGRIESLRDRRFEVGTWNVLCTGTPALEAAEAVFDCRVIGCIEVGTHVILTGAVEGVRTGNGEPLIYSDRQYRVLDSTPAARRAGG